MVTRLDLVLFSALRRDRSWRYTANSRIDSVVSYRGEPRFTDEADDLRACTPDRQLTVACSRAVGFSLRPPSLFILAGHTGSTRRSSGRSGKSDKSHAARKRSKAGD